MTSRLRDGVIAYCDKAFEKDDPFRRRLLMYSEFSETTIGMVKQKYDELRDQFDQLKLSDSKPQGKGDMSCTRVSIHLHK